MVSDDGNTGEFVITLSSATPQNLELKLLLTRAFISLKFGLLLAIYFNISIDYIGSIIYIVETI